MIKRTVALLCALTILAWASPVLAQPVNLPANSVWGRLGIGTGPGQAIPFSVLGPNLAGHGGLITGPTSSTVGDMAYFTGTTGGALGDAPFQWQPLGGPSGSGIFALTSTGGLGIISPDLTTFGNTIQLGGTIRVGDTIRVTLNYNNAASVARSVTISYGPVTGADTLTTIAAGLGASLVAQGTVAPLLTDFGTFRFFIPGTVALGTGLMKFNFVYPMTASLAIVNSSTAGTPTTMTINSTLTAVGGTGTTLFPLDQVAGISISRNVGGTRAGVANDNLAFLIVDGNTSNPAVAVQYANVVFGVSDPTAAAPVGYIQLATGNSTSAQATVNIVKGMTITNVGNSLTPTYPGALPLNQTSIGDPGTGSLRMQGWVFAGNAIVGTSPQNSDVAIFGNNFRDMSVATNFALAHGSGGNTVVNAFTGQTISLQIANNNAAVVNGDRSINLTIATEATSPTAAALMAAGGIAAAKKIWAGTSLLAGVAGSARGSVVLAGNTSGSQTQQPAATTSGTITWPAGTVDFSATGGTSQVVKQTSAGGIFTVAQLAATDLSNVTAARLLGNPTGSAAAPSEISLGATLAFSGTALQTAAMTSDVTAPANSFVTTVAKIAGTTVSGTSGTGNVAFTASPTFTGTLAAAAINASGTVTAASTFNANSASGAYQLNGVNALTLSGGNINLTDSAGSQALVITTSLGTFDRDTMLFRTNAATEFGRLTAAKAAFVNGTAIPAGGTAGTGITVSSATNFGIFFGSGAPTLSAAKGSIYLRSDGAINARLYINTDGSTTWTAFNTASWLLWRDIDPAANDNSPAFLEKVG